MGEGQGGWGRVFGGPVHFLFCAPTPPNTVFNLNPSSRNFSLPCPSGPSSNQREWPGLAGAGTRGGGWGTDPRPRALS